MAAEAQPAVVSGRSSCEPSCEPGHKAARVGLAGQTPTPSSMPIPADASPQGLALALDSTARHSLLRFMCGVDVCISPETLLSQVHVLLHKSTVKSSSLPGYSTLRMWDTSVLTPHLYFAGC